MPVILGILTSLLIVGVVVYLGFVSHITSAEWAAWVQAIGSIGAILIAIWVVRYQSKKAEALRQRERMDNDFRSGVAALHSIFMMWNTQVQLQNERINPYRNRKDAWLNMGASPPSPAPEKVILKDIWYLLQGDSTTYAEIVLEEERYHATLLLLETRSKILLNDVWPRLSEAKVEVGAASEEARIKEIVGINFVRQLQVMTDSSILFIDNNVRTSKELFTKYRAVLERRFPNEKIFNAEFPA